MPFSMPFSMPSSMLKTLKPETKKMIRMVALLVAMLAVLAAVHLLTRKTNRKKTPKKNINTKTAGGLVGSTTATVLKYGDVVAIENQYEEHEAKSYLETCGGGTHHTIEASCSGTYGVYTHSTSERDGKMENCTRCDKQSWMRCRIR